MTLLIYRKQHRKISHPLKSAIALFTRDPPPEVDSNPDSGPRNISPVYTGPPTTSGLESRLRPRRLGDPDHDPDRLRLHGAESGNSSRKVVLCKRGYSTGGLGYPDYRLRLHGADSRTGSRKVVSCKQGLVFIQDHFCRTDSAPCT